MRCYEEFYVGKIPADVPLQRAVVLFTEPSEHLCRR